MGTPSIDIAACAPRSCAAGQQVNAVITSSLSKVVSAPQPIPSAGLFTFECSEISSKYVGQVSVSCSLGVLSADVSRCTPDTSQGLTTQKQTAVKSALTLQLGALPPDTKVEDVQAAMNTPAAKDSMKESIAQGIGVDSEKVTINSITVQPARRRLKAQGALRRLQSQSMELQVDFEVLIDTPPPQATGDGGAGGTGSSSGSGSTVTAAPTPVFTAADIQAKVMQIGNSSSKESAVFSQTFATKIEEAAQEEQAAAQASGGNTSTSTAFSQLTKSVQSGVAVAHVAPPTKVDKIVAVPTTTTTTTTTTTSTTTTTTTTITTTTKVMPDPSDPTFGHGGGSVPEVPSTTSTTTIPALSDEASSTKEEDKGLGAGAYAGIFGGSGCFLVALVAGALFLKRKRKSSNERKDMNNRNLEEGNWENQPAKGIDHSAPSPPPGVDTDDADFDVTGDVEEHAQPVRGAVKKEAHKQPEEVTEEAFDLPALPPAAEEGWNFHGNDRSLQVPAPEAEVDLDQDLLFEAIGQRRANQGEAVDLDQNLLLNAISQQQPPGEHFHPAAGALPGEEDVELDQNLLMDAIGGRSAAPPAATRSLGESSNSGAAIVDLDQNLLLQAISEAPKQDAESFSLDQGRLALAVGESRMVQDQEPFTLDQNLLSSAVTEAKTRLQGVPEPDDVSIDQDMLTLAVKEAKPNIGPL